MAQTASVSNMHSGLSSATATRVAIVSGLLLAFAMRLYRLGAESLWYDETVSAYLARQSLGDLVAHTALDIHPPGYYAVLHGWTSIVTPFGRPELEYLLAFPSLWFGVITIALLVPLGVRLLGEAVAALAVWLAALHPFLVWYGQEVRMYTVASALGLLCLWCAVRFVARHQSHDQSTDIGLLVSYAFAAAAGLYTLYYFAFALVAINIALVIIVYLSRHILTRPSRIVMRWLIAQFAAVFLFSPWLPLFARQVMDPPVPAWRMRWESIGETGIDAASALAAYLVGHSIPELVVWLWAGIVVFFMFAYYGYTKSQATAGNLALWLPLYAFVPPALIFFVSIIAVPIFHVRYLSIYAPVFALIMAAGLLYLLERRRILFVLGVAALASGSVHSLARYWAHPAYRPDNHRAAVAQLARDWRPGDAILVNAGWVYTAIDIYWPSALAGHDQALPPGPITWARLTDFDDIDRVPIGGEISQDALMPLGVTTGSIDGSPSLGWGSSDADFYAIGAEETGAALDLLADNALRIWHYRLYDTVSDPQGLIRNWLASNLSLRSETAFSGNGYLLLQEYHSEADEGTGSVEAGSHTVFENGLALDSSGLPDISRAGSYVYVPVEWRLRSVSGAPEPLAASLRLIDESGHNWAQHDQALPEISSRSGIDTIGQVLALPIPASTPPGSYDVLLIVYQANSLRPLTFSTEGGESRAVNLGTLELGLPFEVPIVGDTLTRFDYLELVDSSIPAGPVAAGQSLEIDLVWRPAPNKYKDAYASRISVVGPDETIVVAWEMPLGSTEYPTSMWPARYPVRDQLRVEIPGGVEEGEYRLMLEVRRISDGLTIPSRPRKWLPFSDSAFELGTITIEN